MTDVLESTRTEMQIRAPFKRRRETRENTKFCMEKVGNEIERLTA